MSTKRKRAAGGTAQNNKPHIPHYGISMAASRERLRLGELLLLLLQAPLEEAQRQAWWKLFEIRLREYLDLRGGEVCR